MLARTKLNSIESKISKELKSNEISHEDFMAIINEEKKIQRTKEKLQNDNIQRSDTEKVILKKAKKQALMKLLCLMKLLITV